MSSGSSTRSHSEPSKLIKELHALVCVQKAKLTKMIEQLNKESSYKYNLSLGKVTCSEKTCPFMIEFSVQKDACVPIRKQWWRCNHNHPSDEDSGTDFELSNNLIISLD